jgi:glycosyltransferase involved in cell wall biosynthesis
LCGTVKADNSSGYGPVKEHFWKAVSAYTNEDMKISFLIPAFNEEKQIGQCLGSVQKEIARAGLEHDTEIIVINNASTDRTREIVLGCSGVHLVDEPQKGVSRARQAGFLASRGELLANIDADTLVPPGWLDAVTRDFARDPQLVALSGPFIYYDLPVFQRDLIHGLMSTFSAPNFFLQYVLRIGAVLQGGNFVVRRDALLKIGGFDTSIDFYGDDANLARRMSKVGYVKWAPRLSVYTSGRRLKKEGVARTIWRYAVNFFWSTFIGRPYTTEHTDIRSA